MKPPRVYFASEVDKRLEGRWRGEVFCQHGTETERVAYVYGKTVDDMRRVKHAMVAALNAVSDQLHKSG